MTTASIRGKLESLIQVYDLDIVDDCESLVESVETYPYLSDFPTSWTQGKTGSSTVSNYRTSQFLHMNPMIETPELDTHPMTVPFRNMLLEIDKKIIEYRDEHDLHLNKDEVWGLNKYGVGGQYKAHYDHGPNSPRLLSAVAFVNDDFEGGELQFQYFNKSIHPKTGRLVLFPSSFIYRHSSIPVEEGVKYSLVTWLI